VVLSTRNVNAPDQHKTDTNIGNKVESCTLAGWPTASARDWKDTPGMSETGTNPDGSERTRLDQLPRVAALAVWPTLNAPNGGRSSPNMTATGMKDGQKRQADLQHIARMAGPTSPSSHAATAKPGVLNPALSRWLQGFPVAWCQAAIRAWRKLKQRPRRGKCG
jgi:hypothetical protein